MRNRLHEGGLRSRRACIRIPLTQRHRQDRLNWARAHVNWRVADWALYFSQTSRGLVLTSQIVVHECGEGQENDIRTLMLLNMTDMVVGR